MNRTNKAISKSIRLIKAIFAPYVIIDNYGTLDYYFTLDDAIADLVNCSPVAVIGLRAKNKVVAHRIQGSK